MRIMANSNTNSSEREIDMQDMYRELYDDDEPTILLRQGVNMSDLCREDGNGAEFEVDNSSPFGDELADYQEDKMYQNLRPEALDDDEDVESGDESRESESHVPFASIIKGMEKLTEDGGVRKRVLKEGVGNVVPDNVQILVHYNGYREYDDEPFDSTRLRNTPLKYVLGSHEMLPGLEIGIGTMRKCEEAQFVLSPQYAFGPGSCGPRVPKNSSLLFDVELLKWEECSELCSFYKLTMEERRNCDFKMLKTVANHYAEEGRDRYKQKKFSGASAHFLKAIKAMDQFHPKDEADENEWRKELIKMYQNTALCQLQLCHAPRAIHFSNGAIALDENCAKAWYTKGKALSKIGDFKPAKHALLKARSLDPKNRAINKELIELDKKIQRYKENEKVMCQNMFPTCVKENKENKSKKSRQKQTATTQVTPITEDFRQAVEKQLQDFKDDHSLMELPLPRNTYSEAELNFIEDKANEFGLDHTEKFDGLSSHIRLCKRQAETSGKIDLSTV